MDIPFRQTIYVEEPTFGRDSSFFVGVHRETGIYEKLPYGIVKIFLTNRKEHILHTYQKLREMSNGYGQIFVPQQIIADTLAISRKTLYNHLSYLKQKGMVTKEDGILYVRGNKTTIQKVDSKYLYHLPKGGGLEMSTSEFKDWMFNVVREHTQIWKTKSQKAIISFASTATFQLDLHKGLTDQEKRKIDQLKRFSEELSSEGKSRRRWGYIKHEKLFKDVYDILVSRGLDTTGLEKNTASGSVLSTSAQTTSMTATNNYVAKLVGRSVATVNRHREKSVIKHTLPVCLPNIEVGKSLHFIRKIFRSATESGKLEGVSQGTLDSAKKPKTDVTHYQANVNYQENSYIWNFAGGSVEILPTKVFANMKYTKYSFPRKKRHKKSGIKENSIMYNVFQNNPINNITNKEAVITASNKLPF